MVLYFATDEGMAAETFGFPNHPRLVNSDRIISHVSLQPFELTTSSHSPCVGSDCSSVGIGAAFGGLIGGDLLTAGLSGGGVAVTGVYRAKREVTARPG